MPLQAQHFYSHLSKLVKQQAVCVAFSGGVDSHVLLHLLSQAPTGLFVAVRAVHVHHGLHPDAESWTQHCLKTATALGIEITISHVSVEKNAGAGLEAAARQARYLALADELAKDEVLLTAQHQQDQAETLLLQLLRGAGPQGLSAMQRKSQLFDMTVVRPFLSFSRDEIVAYAHQHQLQWIEDPSNVDIQINRNYLRHQLMPLLQQRWPAVAKTLSRSAQHCAEATQLLADIAKQDAQHCQVDINQVDIKAFLELSQARQRNVLRFIIEQAQLPLPSAVQTQQIIDEVCLAREDAMPEIRWADIVVRRFQNVLYFEQVIGKKIDPHWSVQIDSTRAVSLPTGNTLKWKTVTANGLDAALIERGLTCRFRQGGERIRLVGQRQHKTLKHLFQQWQLPPWQRSRIPLLFCNNELVAVVGYACAHGFVAEDKQEAWQPYIE